MTEITDHCKELEEENKKLIRKLNKMKQKNKIQRAIISEQDKALRYLVNELNKKKGD
ncbi:MAG: hypothetical protein QW292_14385 [Candidatus Parvarchaeota archaeon]